MKKRFAFLRTFIVPSWTFPLALLIFSLIAYGFLLPQWGFYWDDWAKISVPTLFGEQGYWNYYAEDRPLSAWTHLVFTPLLGETPLTWQLFQFGLQVLTAWAIYRLLLSLWPQARWQSAATALIFAIHPAFLQHPVAVTFHQQWLQYALVCLSFWIMLESVRQLHRGARWFWPLTGLSLALSAAQLSVTEYFAPLELLRPLLLWLLIGSLEQQPAPRRLLKTLAFAAPYLGLIAAYGIWRLFFIQLSGDDPYRTETLYALLESPLPALFNLGAVAIQDSLYILITAWARWLISGPIEDLTRTSALTIAIGTFTGLLALTYLSRLRASDVDDAPAKTPNWTVQALLVGLAAFTLGVLPAWITGREVVFDFHSDRYALPGLLGSSLLVVAVIQWLADTRLKRALLVSVLVGLGVLAQLNAGFSYSEIWDQQKTFFWQLYWRAPFIEPGTALLTEKELFANQGLFSSSAALNLLYPQRMGREYLAYWWYSLAPKYTAASLPNPLFIRFQTQFRTLTFHGNSRRALLAHVDPFHTNCVWLIGPDDQDEPVLNELMREATVLSDLKLIESMAPLAEDWRPPENLFGPEPAHGWCYYFEQGDYHAQRGEWKAAAELGDVARELGYTPKNPESDAPREWQPFISAYAHRDHWAEAAELTLQAAEDRTEHNTALCNLWSGLNQSIPYSSNKEAALSQVTQALACKQRMEQTR